MNAQKSLGHVLLATLAAGVLIALALTPAAGLAGAAAHRTTKTMESNLADMTSGWTPGVTTINDSTGQPIARLFKQNRTSVNPDQIAQPMKDAIVSIEDRRFYEHDGVDIQSTARALLTNLFAGGVEQGASTLNQQYVKNYLLLVTADSEEEQQAATEQSIPRKLREMRMATELDKQLSKDEILTRYLNLVPFGNHAYGIQSAAQTYFGVDAAQLTVPQSAMLAGMVQSSEYLNPYTNTDEVIARRNTVLQSMVDFGAIDQATADLHAGEPLGVLESPNIPTNGCIGSGNAGFFCDYALTYLQAKGIDEEQLRTEALTINTTLDPQAQEAAHSTVVSNVSPTQPGVAQVLNVVEPGKDSRRILAMTSSRNYGLDAEAGETYLPQPTSLVGNGAGSVFKVFTAAAALEQGRGLNDVLPVPTRYEAQGLGDGGADNCPPGRYCVENAGTYKPQMTMAEALAHSPNTTFVQLIEQVGVPAVVDMSVKLGLRSYDDPGTYNEDHSIASYFKEANLGSYTLGPTPVNPLELSNVGATLGSEGMWCEPSPIEKVLNPQGDELALERPECEQVVDPQLAGSLSQAMTLDIKEGTASEAAKALGFGGTAAAKTGTTESHQSAAFLGFNNAIAAAPYIFNDGTSTAPLCTSPVRQCGEGTLFGGKEPARTFFGTVNQLPRAMAGGLSGSSGAYEKGELESIASEVRGQSEAQARNRLSSKGYSVTSTSYVSGSGYPRGTVVGVAPERDRKVVLQISDGTGSRPASPSPSSPGTTGTPQRPEQPAGPSELDRAVEDLNNTLEEFRRNFGL
ncbi:penicillin-binding protein [Corynebacterium tapiri]|uniref:penicillin-binding protein n=1 Tax=Corynebacterium tapiri TaxID=1448266 RepID=UPI001FE95BF9|nr:penicillin-binding protein [Corynebacterium tapiri]